MKSFFVIFGKGILYFLAFPFVLVFLVVYGLYMFVQFLIMLFKTIVLFFQGKPVGVKDELDEKAMLILKERKKEQIKNNFQSVQNINNQNTINQTINNYNIGAVPPQGSSSVTPGISQQNSSDVLQVEGMQKVEPISTKETNNDVIIPLNLEDRND